jgi:acyl carrier protein
MSIKDRIFSEIEKIRSHAGDDMPPLSDDLMLLDSGLDSLGVAVLVTRLEDQLGVDPFTESAIASPPTTVGEFVRLYENAAR